MKKSFAIILVVVLAFGMLAGCGKDTKKKSGYAGSLDDYEKLMNGDVSNLEALAPEAFWDWYADVYEEEEDEEFDFEDYQDDVLDAIEDFLDEKEDDVGKDVKITVEIQKEEQLDEDYVESLGEYLEKKYDIDEKDVTEAYELKLKVVAKGKEDEDTSKDYFVMAKIQDEWYALSVEDDKGEVTYANFVIENMG